MGDHLGQQPAMSTPLAQASAQADDAICVARAGNLADQRQSIGRIGDRPVDHRVDAGSLQARQPADRAFHHVHHAIQVVGAQRVDVKPGSMPSVPQVLQPCS